MKISLFSSNEILVFVVVDEKLFMAYHSGPLGPTLRRRKNVQIKLWAGENFSIFTEN